MPEAELNLYNFLKNIINAAEKNDEKEVSKLKDIYGSLLKKTFKHLKDFYTNEKVLQYDRCYQFILSWIGIKERREEFLKKAKIAFDNIQKPES